MLFLTVGLIAVIIAAVWYYGSSRRASQAAYQFNQMAQKFQEQSDLLQLVTDSQPTSIFILDKDDKYRFANRQAAKDAGISAAEMVGKPIANVLGPAAAKRVMRLNHQAMEENRTVTEYGPVEIGGRQKVVQSEHIPLKGTARRRFRRALGRGRHHRFRQRARAPRPQPQSAGEDPGQRGRPARSLRRAALGPRGAWWPARSPRR